MTNVPLLVVYWERCRSREGCWRESARPQRPIAFGLCLTELPQFLPGADFDFKCHAHCKIDVHQLRRLSGMSIARAHGKSPMCVLHKISFFVAIFQFPVTMAADTRSMFSMICANNVNRSTEAHDHLHAARRRQPRALPGPVARRPAHLRVLHALRDHVPRAQGRERRAVRGLSLGLTMPSTN